MSYVADLHCGILALSLNAQPEELVEQGLAEITSSPFQGQIVVLTKRGMWLKNKLELMIRGTAEAVEASFED